LRERNKAQQLLFFAIMAFIELEAEAEEEEEEEKDVLE
jgi:hypothetical protein